MPATPSDVRVGALRGRSSTWCSRLSPVNQASRYGQAYNAVNTAEKPSTLSRAENRLQTALHKAFHVAEGYPELQTDREFLELRSELSESENKVQASRRFYNGSVREFNAKTKTFPSSLMTKGEQEREFFDAADRAAIAEPPRIQF